jgi:hypothetical protein
MSTLAHLAKAKTVDSHLKSSDAPSFITNILCEPDVVRNKTLESLYTRWLSNKVDLGSTAWALYNAMTEWATHEVPTRKITQKNIASVKLDRLDKVRKTLNEKMLPELKLVA